MRRKIAFATIFILFASGHLSPQMVARPDQPARATQKPTFEDLITAARRYFRDTAELPMLQTTTFSVTDGSGHASKPKTLRTTYVFQGYSRRRQNAKATLHGNLSVWSVMRGSKMMKISVNSAIWTMLPGVRLYSEPGKYRFEVMDEPTSGEFRAKLVPSTPCPSFTITNDSYAPDHTCGETEFEVDKNLAFKSFTFEAPNLPALVTLDRLGRCTMRRYRAELQFQSVMLPGDNDPFLVPRQVTATMETDKGTVVISSVYEPRQTHSK